MAKHMESIERDNDGYVGRHRLGWFWRTREVDAGDNNGWPVKFRVKLVY